MIASARNLYILKRLHECGIVDYKSIASELAVSEATVRRDFEKLERQGKLRRVQGGAVRSEMPEAEFGVELSMRAKHGLNSVEKNLVARAAAQEVRDGECVFLDMGTSIAPLAQDLLQKRIRIVTCSNLILQRVTPESQAEVFVVGGQFLPADHMFVGSIAENMLENFGFHRAFIGCMGLDIDADTVYVTDMECMRIKQIAMKNAAQSSLLADTTKLKKVGLFRVAGVESFQRVYINDAGTGEHYPENFIVVSA